MTAVVKSEVDVEMMAIYVPAVQQVIDALNSAKKPIDGSRIYLFCVACKRDVNDMRESPALDIQR